MADHSVILNGELLAANQARVPVEDRGLLYGESVFTTLRCYGGVPFRLEAHCRRLNASLGSRAVGINYQVELEDLRSEISRLLKANGCPDAVVRLTVTGGSGAGLLPPQKTNPTTLLTTRQCEVSTVLYSEGASLMVSSVRRDPKGELGKHKLGSYFPSLLARREAAALGCDEGVICDTDDSYDTGGNYLECASSNLFAVVGGTLVTPDRTENLLPGVTRQAVLECAEALSVKVKLETLSPEIVEHAEEWFITNSALEVVPVLRIKNSSIEKKRFPVPGAVTARLMEAYRELVRSETKPG